MCVTVESHQQTPHARVPQRNTAIRHAPPLGALVVTLAVYHNNTAPGHVADRAAAKRRPPPSSTPALADLGVISANISALCRVGVDGVPRVTALALHLHSPHVNVRRARELLGRYDLAGISPALPTCARRAPLVPSRSAATPLPRPAPSQPATCTVVVVGAATVTASVVIAVVVPPSVSRRPSIRSRRRPSATGPLADTPPPPRPPTNPQRGAPECDAPERFAEIFAERFAERFAEMHACTTVSGSGLQSLCVRGGGGRVAAMRTRSVSSSPTPETRRDIRRD